MNLHERIAKKLGWTVAEARSFSLPALRELLRPIPGSEKLVAEMTELIRSGRVILPMEGEER